ncbi:hypothetical protein TNCV_1662441 [Trichonephila clavipes]|nr:hypothetical protein TNCV_1662441 [Trichonephila clavipes]
MGNRKNKSNSQKRKFTGNRFKERTRGRWMYQHRKFSHVVGGRRRKTGDPGQPQGLLPLNWGGTEQNRTVTCMVLKAKANDRRKNCSHYLR